MAWTYMTGVMLSSGSHFHEAASTHDRTNIAHLRPKAIRRIYQQANRPWTSWVRQQTDLFARNGKFHIPCIGDHDSAHWLVKPEGVNPGQPQTTATWAAACRELKAAIYPGSSVIEILNEPFVQYWDGRAGTGDKVWDRIREASAIFRGASGNDMEVLMSCPPTGTNKDLAFLNRANAVNIWPYIDGFVLHPYSTNPGSAASPLSVSDPPGSSVLGWTWQRRKQVNAFGAVPTSKHLWITEFGWCTHGTTGPQHLRCTEPVAATRLTQAYTAFENHCEELKLRAACYFSWNDWNTSGSTDAFDYSGIRTNEVPPNPKAPETAWYYKGGGGQVGTIGASPGGMKAAIDSFEPEVVIGSPPVIETPVAVTQAANPVGLNTATLRGNVDPGGGCEWFMEYSLDPLPPYDFLDLGFNFTCWDTNAYGVADAATSMDNMVATDANSVGLIVTWFQATPTSNVIAREEPGRTASDASLVTAIQRAKARGLKTFLRPLVDEPTYTTYRGTFAPSNPTAWFASYTAYINYYADFAEANDVDVFSVGVELDDLTVAGYEAEWRAIIAGVRSRFSGEVVYCANQDNWQGRPWLYDSLDYIGIDWYSPLSSSSTENPTVATLVNRWSSWSGTTYLADLAAVSATYGKQVLFTEFGYASMETCLVQPWATGGTYNGTKQDRALDAGLQVLFAQPWFKGMYIWHWSYASNHGGITNTDHYVRGKPAAATVTAGFGSF